jgi:hypothetical protein
MVSKKESSDVQEEFINVDEIEKRLTVLWEKDNRWPALIAARAALRVFPFIVNEADLNNWFWPVQAEMDSENPQDNRVLYILALVYVLITLFLGRKISIKLPYELYQISFPSHELEAAAKVLEADSIKNANSVIAAGEAIKAAVNSVESPPEFAKQVLSELEQAEQADSLDLFLATPLWPDKIIPEEVHSYYNERFKPAIERLAKEAQSESSSTALIRVLDIYERTAGIITENPDEAEVRADREITEDNANIQQDSLNRKALVDGLAAILSYKENEGHLTIGLLGHWGSGKSSLMSLVKEQLQQTSKVPFLFGEFNAWAYEHSDNIQAAMAHEVINSLTSHPRESTNEKGIWVALKNYFAWLPQKYRLVLSFSAHKYPFRFSAILLQVLAILWIVSSIFVDRLSAGFDFLFELLHLDFEAFGPAWQLTTKFGLLAALVWNSIKDARITFGQSLTKDWLTYVKLPDYAKHIGEVSEMRKDITLMCKIRLGFNQKKASNKKRLLFVVDDLDRCGPAGIVKTFEAIRLVLNIPQVTVVIAIDQRIALAALAKHYEPLEKHHQLQNAKTIARDYLGKMIQLPIVLPEPDQTAISQLMGNVWDDNDQAIQQWRGLINPARELEENTSGSFLSHPELSDTKSDDIEITEDQMATIVNQMEIPPVPKTGKPIVGVSPSQKAAFVFWSSQFGLNNPRQLKRLHNSYNLLRTVYGDEDPKLANYTHAYPCMVALMLLEWVNNQQQSDRRNQLRQYLLRGGQKPGACKAVFDNALAIIENHQIVEFLAIEIKQSRTQLLRFVDLFVLPAIEESSNL